MSWLPICLMSNEQFFSLGGWSKRFKKLRVFFKKIWSHKNTLFGGLFEPVLPARSCNRGGLLCWPLGRRSPSAPNLSGWGLTPTRLSSFAKPKVFFVEGVHFKESNNRHHASELFFPPWIVLFCKVYSNGEFFS